MKSILIAALAALAACAGGQKQAPASAAQIGKTRTIVLIHGLYLTPKSWEEWKPLLEGRGYKVHAPAYPLLDGNPSEIRAKNPDPALAALTLEQVKGVYRDYIRKLDEKPILIGHSMGGLIAQQLLAEGDAAGAIVLDSAPPLGVVSQLTALRHGCSFVTSAWPVISPFAGDDEPIFMTEETFASTFANGLSASQAKRDYDAFVVPSSRRIPRGALTEAGRVDFARARGPLLLIAGEEDRIIPPSVVRLNYDAYEASAGTTDLREFPGRGHFIGRQDGWKEVAEFALAWIEAHRGP